MKLSTFFNLLEGIIASIFILIIFIAAIKHETKKS